MIKKLRKDFIFITMGIITGMLIVIFALIYSFTAWNLNAQADTLLDTLLSNAQPTKTALPYFTVSTNPWGSFRVEGKTDFNIENESLMLEILDIVKEQNQQSGTIEKYNLRYRVRLSYADWKIAFVDTSSHQNTLWALVQISILVGLVSLVVFLGICILLAKWAVSPVKAAWQKQKQFISDASHELKTPLTVIMSNTELLQNTPSTDSAHDRYCENILTMSQQMRNLVEGMLTLAQADNGKVQTLFQPLDFSDLVSRTTLPFEPLLYEKNCLLRCEIAPGIHISGSAQHLQQVVEILLDNAGKYAIPGIIRLTLTRQGRNALLSVSNPGAPIPPEDRKRIFQRFYRTDQARERNGSFGLGLAIAQSIVTDHGGKIWVESNDSGNCFFVQLPL